MTVLIKNRSMLLFVCDGGCGKKLMSFPGEKWKDFYVRTTLEGWFHKRVDENINIINCYCASCQKRREKAWGKRMNMLRKAQKRVRARKELPPTS